MGFDVRTLQNYKLLADMIPELSDLVETGILAPTTALAIMRKTKDHQLYAGGLVIEEILFQCLLQNMHFICDESKSYT